MSKPGLPKIAPYALPTADEVPAARVPWTPDSRRVALLVHDMQAYFIRAFTREAAPIAPAIENILALRRRCRERDIPVFFSAQPGGQDSRDRGLQRDFWGPGMRNDPSDSAIVPDLAPVDGEIVLTKWRYSAFQRTNLEPMLQARGRDQLIVTGVYAHIGCLMTAAEAFMRDVEPFLVADATADFSREKHDLALTYAAERCAVPMTTSAVLSVL